jgi:hypothetical protein
VETWVAAPVPTSMVTNWLVATKPKTLLPQKPMPQMSA